MNYFGVVSLLNGVLGLLTGLYVLLRNRRNPLYVSFSWFAFSISFWAILYAVWQAQDSRPEALFFVRLLMAPCYFIPFAFFWFVLTLIEDENRKRYLPLCLIPPFIFLFFSFSGWMIPDVTSRLYFPYWPVPGPLMHVYVVIFFLILIWAYSLLFSAWFRTSGPRRSQLKWITVTTLLAWGGGSTNWFLWYGIPIPPIPNFFVAVFFLLIAYAVIRRSLFDVDTLADCIQEAKLSSLGILAAGLLHQIRSPLFAAKGYAESLLKEERDRKGIEKLEKIIAQVDRASVTAGRFLKFAKPRAGDQEAGPVHLDEILEEALSLLGHELESAKIKVEKELSAGAVLRIDRWDIEEIFINLITNAYQAMPQGGVLRVRDEKQNGSIRIHLSDTGAGIPSPQIKKIFEPFFSSKGEKGTGLGLYMVKRLVERNGGRISVSSRPGEGTRFILEFQGRT